QQLTRRRNNLGIISTTYGPNVRTETWTAEAAVSLWTVLKSEVRGATPPHFVHWSTQSFTVLYQSREFCGFSTQWPSSGKYSIFDGTPITCSVVKSWKPSLTSRR